MRELTDAQSGWLIVLRDGAVDETETEMHPTTKTMLERMQQGGLVRHTNGMFFITPA